MGEAKRKALAHQKQAIALDTFRFGGRVHVEWDPLVAVTPLGHLPFFIEFLKVSRLFDAWVCVFQTIVTSRFRPVTGDFKMIVTDFAKDF